MIWGAQLSEDMDKTLRVLLIVTGVKSSQILGPGERTTEKKQREMADELGIDFVE